MVVYFQGVSITGQSRSACLHYILHGVSITLNMRVISWHFLSADFGVFVGLTMTCFREEMLISNICIRGFMCSAIKKS